MGASLLSQERRLSTSQGRETILVAFRAGFRSHALALSCAHYFPALATQANTNRPPQEFYDKVTQSPKL